MPKGDTIETPDPGIPRTSLLSNACGSDQRIQLITPGYSYAERSPIYELPRELLYMIFHHLDPIDGLCLALSCKLFLNLSATLQAPIQFPSLKAHQHRSHAMCRNVHMYLQRMMPHRAICSRCLRVLPLEPRWWDIHGPATFPELEWQSTVQEEWSQQKSTICPECEINGIGARQAFPELRRKPKNKPRSLTIPQ